MLVAERGNVWHGHGSPPCSSRRAGRRRQPRHLPAHDRRRRGRRARSSSCCRSSATTCPGTPTASRRTASRHGPGTRSSPPSRERAAQHGAYVKLNVTHAYPTAAPAAPTSCSTRTARSSASSDKQVLMGAENDHLDPAAEIGPVVDTPLGRLGMYSCMDGVINEVARGLALRGAQVLLNSLNSFALDEANLHIPVRAAENKVWVVAANKVGPLLPAEHLPSDERQPRRARRVAARRRREPGRGPRRHRRGQRPARPARPSSSPTSTPTLADDKRRPDGTDVFAARRPELYAPDRRRAARPSPPRRRRRAAGRRGRAGTTPRRPRSSSPRPPPTARSCWSRRPATPSAVAARPGRHRRVRRHHRRRRPHRRARQRRRRAGPAAAAAPAPTAPTSWRSSNCPGARSRSSSATTPSTRRRSGSRPSPTPTSSRCRSRRSRSGS